VQCCIEAAQAHRQWQTLCHSLRSQHRRLGAWSPDREDFTWLETAFCNKFLKDLRWFASMDHEWRTGGNIERGGFYVLLWSKSPARLWWELLDAIERELASINRLPLQSAGPGADLFRHNYPGQSGRDRASM
jgi:hypothetical protein